MGCRQHELLHWLQGCWQSMRLAVDSMDLLSTQWASSMVVCSIVVGSRYTAVVEVKARCNMHDSRTCSMAINCKPHLEGSTTQGGSKIWTLYAFWCRQNRRDNIKVAQMHHRPNTHVGALVQPKLLLPVADQQPCLW